MVDQPHIFDLDPSQLRQLVSNRGMPQYRADQVLRWVYQNHVTDPNQMLNIPQVDRRRLADRLRFQAGRVIHQQLATDQVHKLLIQWDTPNTPRSPLPIINDPAQQTECVLIPSNHGIGPHDTSGRKTACVSSQIGCPVGCTFCASGRDGLKDNLTCGQILEQVWQLSTLPGIGRVTHVVFMGMGEPLANFNQVIQAVRTLTADWGFGISARRITISTVGLPAQIRRLAKIDLPITLAISLHAPNDTLRRKLIPWARYVSVQELIDAGRDYFRQTKREVTLEYTLLHTVNDQPAHAHELVTVAKQLRSNVNLIRYNEVASMPYNRPSSDAVHRFQAILRAGGINTHIRASRGRDIAAACGQLKLEHTTTG